MISVLKETKAGKGQDEKVRQKKALWIDIYIYQESWMEESGEACKVWLKSLSHSHIQKPKEESKLIYC